MTAKKIALKLPDELVEAIDIYATAIGKSRTSVIVNVLKQAFELPHDEVPTTGIIPTTEGVYEEQLKELAALKARLSELEKKVAIQTEQIAEVSRSMPLDRSVIQLTTALSEPLIGLVTESSISVQQMEEVKPEITDVLASHYVQMDDFLTVKEKSRLLDYVLQQELAFVSATTDTNALDYRRSRVLYSGTEFSELVVNRIQPMIPDILCKLGLSLFSASKIEAQLTAHNDGNYYKIHNDNGSPETATRALSYVYYFYRKPKPFSGGELLIYDSKIENNFYVAAKSFKTVEPRNNSIVFFLSRYLHEVLPVSCPSKAFADSRFTINGWVSSISECNVDGLHST